MGGEVVYIHVAQGSGLCLCHDNNVSAEPQQRMRPVP
jgi:hypothetical protein